MTMWDDDESQGDDEEEDQGNGEAKAEGARRIADEGDLRQALMLIQERRRVCRELLGAHFGSSTFAAVLMGILEAKGFISKPQGSNRWSILFDRIDAYLKQYPAVHPHAMQNRVQDHERKSDQQLKVPQIVSDEYLKAGGGLLLVAMGLLALLAVLVHVVGVSKVLEIIHRSLTGG